jgi:hypothetical protein
LRVESCFGFAKAPVLRSSTAKEDGSGDGESNRRRQGQGGRPELAGAARRRLRPFGDKTPLFTRDSVRRGVGHLQGYPKRKMEDNFRLGADKNRRIGRTFYFLEARDKISNVKC